MEHRNDYFFIGVLALVIFAYCYNFSGKADRAIEDYRINTEVSTLYQ